MPRFLLVLAVVVLSGVFFAGVPASAALDPVIVRVFSYDPNGNKASYFEPELITVKTGQTARFVIDGDMYPTSVRFVGLNYQTHILSNIEPTADFTFTAIGQQPYYLTTDTDVSGIATVGQGEFFLAVPIAHGPYASPTPLPATPTPTPPPGPMPGPPSDFSVTYEFGQAKVQFTSPDGQNLTYSYATCNNQFFPCNRLETDAFYSQRTPIEANTPKTLTFSSLRLGYTCFWISHRSGSSASSWYPTSESGTQENCVYR